MEVVTSFVLKSIISSGGMLAYYWCVLRDKPFHNFNRIYVVGSILISLVIPFFHFTWYDVDSTTPSTILNLLLILNSDQPVFDFTWQSVLAMIGLSVSLLLLTALLSKICWVYRIKTQHPIIKMHGFNLIETDLDQAPFTFFNNLFWRKNISMCDENGKKIYQHELIHIAGKHTYDKLFAQVVASILWVNPFYWILQKELCLVHEYIADSKSIAKGDGESFARILLLGHTEAHYLEPSHLFFNSSIKRRLTMITTAAKIHYPYLRKLMVIPVAVLILSIFSFSVVKTPCKELNKDNVKLAKEPKPCVLRKRA